MHVVHVLASMDWSGTPTATMALIHAMQTQDPSIRTTILTKEQGTLGQRVGAVTRPSEVRTRPDLLIVHHSSVAKWAVDAWPSVPRIFYHHGGPVTPDHCPRAISWQAIWSINHQCTEQMRRERITTPILLVRDAVDCAIFHEQTPARETSTPRVLFVSNYKRWRNYQRLEQACATVGASLEAVGSPYGRITNPVELAARMNAADLVVTWGRGVLEAAACGRPVISYDQELGDGYLTVSRFLDSRERNFSGYECRLSMGATELVDALSQYRPAEGQALRTLVTEEHNILTTAAMLVPHLRSICAIL